MRFKKDSPTKSQQEEHFQTLMALSQGGDREAYEQLLNEIEPIVAVCIARKVFRESERDDVVQDILLSIHLARDTYDPARAFLPWMRSIIHNRLVDYFRRNRRQVESVELSEEISDGYTEASIGEASVALRQVVEQLSPAQSRLLTLLTESSGSLEEMTKQLGIEPGNLRVQVHRLLNRFRESLE